MAYVTEAQIKTVIPAPFLNDALADAGNGVAVAGLLDDIIAKASQAADSYLEGIFAVPFVTPPTPVKEAAFVFAVELIYDRRPGNPAGAEWKKKADFWRDRLQKIGNREIPLAASIPKAYASGAILSEKSRINTSTT